MKIAIFPNFIDFTVFEIKELQRST